MLNLNENTATMLIDALTSTQEVVSIIEKAQPGIDTAGFTGKDLVDTLCDIVKEAKPGEYETIIDLNLADADTFASILDIAKGLENGSTAGDINAIDPYGKNGNDDIAPKASTKHTESRTATAYSSLPTEVKSQVNEKIASTLDALIEAAKSASLTAYLIDSDKAEYIKGNGLTFTVDPEAAQKFIEKYEAKVVDTEENKKDFEAVKTMLLNGDAFEIQLTEPKNYKIVGVEISNGEGDANVDIVSKDNLGAHLLTKFGGKVLYQGRPYAGLEVVNVMEKTDVSQKAGSKTKIVPVIKFAGKADIIKENPNIFKTTSVALTAAEAKERYNQEYNNQSVRSALSFKINDGEKTRTIRVSGKVQVPFYDRLATYVDALGALTSTKKVIDMSKSGFENLSKNLVNLLESDSAREYAAQIADPQLKAILDLIENTDTTPGGVDL